MSLPDGSEYHLCAASSSNNFPVEDQSLSNREMWIKKAIVHDSFRDFKESLAGESSCSWAPQSLV